MWSTAGRALKPCSSGNRRSWIELMVSAMREFSRLDLGWPVDFSFDVRRWSCLGRVAWLA